MSYELILCSHICVYSATRHNIHIQLFRERLSNKTVRDNAERYYG